MERGLIVTTDEMLLPKKGSEGATCFDLVLSEDITIAPDAIVKAPTGVKTNFASKIYARSSLAIKKRLKLTNSVGIIDKDYRGEILVSLWNFGKTEVKLTRGERLAQMEVDIMVEQVDASIDAELYEKWDSQTERGAGGFGSTGGYNEDERKKV